VATNLSVGAPRSPLRLPVDPRTRGPLDVQLNSIIKGLPPLTGVNLVVREHMPRGKYGHGVIGWAAWATGHLVARAGEQTTRPLVRTAHPGLLRCQDSGIIFARPSQLTFSAAC